MSAPINLFQRLFRFPTTSSGQPRENQLIESVAHICELSTRFRADFLKLFWRDAPTSNVCVATQSPYSLGASNKIKGIDLEIWAEDDDLARSFTLFIEVKVGSPESWSSAEVDGEFQRQTLSYEKILHDNRDRFGGRIGLFSLTPRLNPLQIDLSPESNAYFLPTKNVFWSDVGLIAEKIARDEKANPVEKYFCREIHQYLKGLGLMDETKMTLQDIAILSEYTRVKTRFWQALEPVAKYLKTAVPGRVDATTWNSSAGREREEDQLIVYRDLNREMRLTVFAGFEMSEGGNPWVGVWVEISPKFSDKFEIIAAACRQQLGAKSPDGSNLSAYYDDKWHLYQQSRDTWAICSKGRPVTEFLASDQPYAAMTEYLIGLSKELLGVKELVELNNT